METLEYDHNLHQNRHAGDDKLYKRFYKDVLPDAEASKDAGRPKFRDVEMVQIIIPGDKKNIVIREAREDDKVRFAKEYAAFKAGEDEPIDGFPLKEWGQITKSMLEELKYMGFRTVEHVANASDAACSKFAGLQMLKTRAKQWLELQTTSAPLDKLNAEIAKRDEENAAMKAQLAEMQKALAELQKKK